MEDRVAELKERVEKIEGLFEEIGNEIKHFYDDLEDIVREKDRRIYDLEDELDSLRDNYRYR